MNDALYSVLQRITTPTLARGYQLPQTGDTTPHRKQLPHQGANAANGGNLPPSRGQRHQRRKSTPSNRPMPPTSRNYPRTGEYQPTQSGAGILLSLPSRRETANQGTKAASGGNLPQGWRQQSNQGKTATLPRTGNNYPIDRRQARYTPQLSHAAICVNGN